MCVSVYTLFVTLYLTLYLCYGFIMDFKYNNVTILLWIILNLVYVEDFTFLGYVYGKDDKYYI